MTSRNKNILIGTMGAVALWLGFPNDFIDMPLLILLFPIALTLLGHGAPSKNSALRSGWLCGLAGSTAALYWITLPVHNVGGLPWPLAFPCAIFVAACLSLANGFFTCTAHILRDCPALLQAFSLSFLWYLLEYICAHLLGFPWLPLAGALASVPLLIQAADIFGAYALGGIWVLVALLCLFSHNHKICLAFALILGACLTSYGALRLEQTPETKYPTESKSFSALFVEANIDQNQKWIPAFQQASLEAYLNLTRQGLADALPQTLQEKPLIIWPETALPFYFGYSPQYDEAVRHLVATSACPLLLGAPGLEITANGQRRIFNRAFLLAGNATSPARVTGTYDKIHLVPFGEYLPSWLAVDFLQALLQGVGVYEEGTSGEPLRHEKLALGMLICYEGIFPWLAEERVRLGANILVDISNDAWFGQTPAARQHLYLSVLRTVEQGRWLLRATNTGISAVVDSRGRLVMYGKQFEAGTHLVRAALLDAPSLYSRLATWIFPLSLISFTILLFIGLKYKQYQK